MYFNLKVESFRKEKNVSVYDIINDTMLNKLKVFTRVYIPVYTMALKNVADGVPFSIALFLSDLLAVDSRSHRQIGVEHALVEFAIKLFQLQFKNLWKSFPSFSP